MSWDKKGLSGSYFYRSVREGKKVLKQYVGCGPKAERAAREVEQRRRDRLAAREALVDEQIRCAEADARLRELDELVTDLVRASLLAGGCYSHRGQWRRKGHDRNTGNAGSR